MRWVAALMIALAVPVACLGDEVQAFRTDDALLFVEGDDREARFDSFAAEVHWRFGDNW